MLARALAEHDETPVEDRIVVLRNATWADYQRMLEMRGDFSAPRLTYLMGEIEIMSPSKEHEIIAGRIGCLVEAWCFERGVEFERLKSWRLESEDQERGAEPDECYVFGPAQEAQRPELVIEVVWTSGGLNKLEIYRKLGVPEVWFWRRGKISVHSLRGEAYEIATQSRVLPDIDLEALVQFLDRPTASQAVREYRAALQARR